MTITNAKKNVVKLSSTAGHTFGLFPDRMAQLDIYGVRFGDEHIPYSATRKTMARWLRAVDKHGRINDLEYFAGEDSYEADGDRAYGLYRFGCLKFANTEVAKIRRWAGVTAPATKQRQRLVKAKAVRA